MTREAWLNKVADEHLWPLIADHDGARAPKVRISVGFPKGSHGGRKSIGQCWPEHASGDKTFEIFISPILAPYDAVSTLLHELIHASVGLKAGHRGPFKRLAVAVGLEGKMTATVAGKELGLKIGRWLKALPKYPHAPMNDGAGAPGKQGPRLIKCECPNCGYTVRVTRKWLEIGNPQCPDGDMMEINS